MAYSRKDLFIKEVSKHSNIRQDVVEIIVNSMVDVIVEEIISKGKFSFLGLFHIKSKEWKSYSIGDKQKVDEHVRLTVGLSKPLKELWKIKFEKFDGDNDVIDRNNWKKVYAEYGSKRVNKSSENNINNNSDKNHDNNILNDNKKHQSKTQTRNIDEIDSSTHTQHDNVKNESSLFNPFLDDDEEDY